MEINLGGMGAAPLIIAKAINERYKALHKKGEELFDVLTNNKFYYGNKE